MKLTKDQEHWANNVQTKPIPSWTEAFEYAYNLGRYRMLVDIDHQHLTVPEQEAIIASLMKIWSNREKQPELIKVDLGPNAGRDYKKDLFKDE